jgi:hypothetical protein
MISSPPFEGRAMPAELFLGSNRIVETGAVVLGQDDYELNIKLHDLTFIIALGGSSTAVQPVKKSATEMLITISTFYVQNNSYKFKVGTLFQKDLYLALHISQAREAHVITYTFSIK